MLELLAHNSDTLEHFRYTDTIRPTPNAFLPPFGKLFMPLAELPHFRTLELNVTNFLSHTKAASTCEVLMEILHRLPAVIEHFRVVVSDDAQGCYASFSAELPSVIPAIPSFLPNLKTFTLVDWKPLQHYLICQREVVALQAAFAGIGVEFVSYAINKGLGEFYCLDDVEPDWV